MRRRDYRIIKYNTSYNKKIFLLKNLVTEIYLWYRILFDCIYKTHRVWYGTAAVWSTSSGIVSFMYRIHRTVRDARCVWRAACTSCRIVWVVARFVIRSLKCTTVGEVRDHVFSTIYFIITIRLKNPVRKKCVASSQHAFCAQLMYEIDCVNGYDVAIVCMCLLLRVSHLRKYHDINVHLSFQYVTRVSII